MPFVTCDACDAESMAPREMVGLKWTCPKCGELIGVSDGGGRAASRSAIRRMRRKMFPAVLLAATAVLLPAVALVLYFATSGPSASRSGENWTHRELAEYLQSRGLKYHMAAANRLGAAYLCDTKDTLGLTEAADGGVFLGGIVRFSKMRDAQAARELVGQTPPTAPVYQWGVWVFEGDKDMLAAIRKVLR